MKLSKHILTLFGVILLALSANRAFSQDFITPVVNCVTYDENSGNYTAHFGYINSHDETIIIRAGKENKLTPGKYKGQATEFLPGTHSFVFSVEFNGSDLTWHIDSDPFHVNVKTSTANYLFTSCMAVSSTVVDLSEQEPLPSVQVLAMHSNLTTTTDIDGLFELAPVPADDTLRFSLDGYLPAEVPVPELGDYAIQLQKIIQGLEPVFASPTPIGSGTGGDTGTGTGSGILEADLLWPELYYLADQYEQGFIFGSNEIFQIDSTDNTVLIEVWANTGADMQALRNLLNSYGFRDPIAGGSSLLITGWYPIEKLKALNEEDALINFVRPVFTPISSQGLVTSKADSSIRAEWARNGYILGGEGVKIGVLSDSYDASGSSAASIVANGDLPGSENSGNPNPVQVLRDNPRGSNEGMGMLEIIHDVAPKADLGFRTGFLSPGDMANGIKELADADYDVIVDDITYLTEPFRPNGQIAKSVDYASNKGVHYLTSAGNFGDKSYGASFSPSASALDFPYLPSANTYAHDFGGGDIFQQISLEPGVYIMELQWDDLFYSQDEMPGTAYDLDIWVVDGLGNLLYSGNRHNTGEDPIEVTAFRITESCIVNIMISGSGIPVGLDFQYVIFRGDGWNFREYPANSSTIIGHASSSSLSSVGSIFYGYTPEFTSDASLTKTNPYSSRGGNLMGMELNKPDFIGADGANTSSFGTDIQFDADNFPNFFGTSAAAPHLAGVMAVVLEASDKYYDNSGGAIKDELSASAMKELLAMYSLDLDDPGVDKISGAGLVDTKATLASMANPMPQDPVLMVPEGASPGNETFTVSVKGKYLDENTQLLMRGEALNITNRTSIDDVTTQIDATVNAFVGNPPLTLYNAPMEGTNGNDGGTSDSVYFFTPQITTVTISVTDTTKKYGEALPQFSFTTSPALSPEELALLPEIAYESSANSLSDVGTYFVSASFGLGSNGDAVEVPVALQEIYEFEFDNGALIVDPLPLTITPNNQTITYGESLNPITFQYDFGEGINIVYADSVMAKIQSEHNNQLTEDTIALINRALPLVNRALPLVNNTAWTISENALNRALPLVNNNRAIEIDASILFDYQDSPSGTIVNRALALVNSSELANGNALISLTDENGNVISNRALALVNRALALVNRALPLVNGETQESAADRTVMIVSEDDSDINRFVSINLVTGLNAASAAEPQYIVPGALYSNNFIVTYQVGELVINKAELNIIAGDAVTNEGEELPEFSATVEGYLFSEDYASVFGDEMPTYTVNPVYDGSAGLYDIIPAIAEPMNYFMTAEKGVLYVNPTLSGNKIRTQLECHEILEDGRIKAYFSYENKDATPWLIPYGENNQLVGVDSFEGEFPEVFMPGLHVFDITWDGTKANWQLTSISTHKTSYASSETASSQGCTLSTNGTVTETASFNYYPNPTNNYVNIDFTAGDVMDASIMVYSQSGFPISVDIQKDQFNNKAIVDLSYLQADFYYIFVNHLDILSSVRIQKN